jgi:hypothetical protein
MVEPTRQFKNDGPIYICKHAFRQTRQSFAFFLLSSKFHGIFLIPNTPIKIEGDSVSSTYNDDTTNFGWTQENERRDPTSSLARAASHVPRSFSPPLDAWYSEIEQKARVRVRVRVRAVFRM